MRALVEARVRRLNLKSKSVAPGQIELNYEVRLRDADTEFVNELGAMEGVGNVVLVSYTGTTWGEAMIRHRHIDLICGGAILLALVPHRSALLRGGSGPPARQRRARVRPPAL